MIIIHHVSCIDSKVRKIFKCWQKLVKCLSIENLAISPSGSNEPHPLSRMPQTNALSMPVTKPVARSIMTSKLKNMYFNNSTCSIMKLQKLPFNR